MTAALDLLVIGAGPAGSALATLAAAAGARTLVLERERLPRDKVCGEFLSAEGREVLERLGVLGELASAGATAIDACRITDRRGRGVEFALPSIRGGGRDGIGISRLRLDAALAAAARRRGAEVRERWLARDPIVRDGRVRGVVARPVAGARAEPIEATVVVAADGRRSLLARRLHPRLGDPRRTARGSRFGLKAHFRVEGAPLGRRVELHVFDGGYVGLAPIEDSRVNLCLLTTAGALRDCGGSPEALLRERIAVHPAVHAAIARGERCSPWASCGPLAFGPRRAAAHGALFLGDAAGTVDPYCGEGMSNALVGAEIVLPFVLEAIARGTVADDLARRYEREWRRSFAGVTRRVRALGTLLARPRLATWILAALRGPGGAIVPRLAAATRTGRLP